jgi:hypothetical protein
MNPVTAGAAPERRRRVRRSALMWGLIAAAFYVGFIVMTLVRGWR